jgi:hypothetical protein
VVFFRRMDYVRLRILQALVPLGTVAVATPLLLSGVGIWALVIGPLCGNALAVAAALPPLAVPAGDSRSDRAATGRYLRFSWPIFARHWRRWRSRRAKWRSSAWTVPGRSRLDHAGGHLDPLRRPRRPDRGHHDSTRRSCACASGAKSRRSCSARRAGSDCWWRSPSGRGSPCSRATSCASCIGEEWEPAIALVAGLALVPAAHQIGYA